jgi:hypothetical protein
MVKEEVTLVRLLSDLHADLLSEGDHEDPTTTTTPLYDATLVVRVLMLHLKHRDSAPAIISLILPILQTLWRRKNQEEHHHHPHHQQHVPRDDDVDGQVAEEHEEEDETSISSCLPCLMRLWKNHVSSISDTLSMLARERLVPTKDLLELVQMHIPDILASANTTDANDDDTATNRTALLGLIHELTGGPRQQRADSTCVDITLYDETWEFVLNPGSSSDNGSTAMMATRIVWHWARRIPHRLVANPRIWDFLRDHWDANAAAALGILVLSRNNHDTSPLTPNTSNSSEDLTNNQQQEQQRQYYYPDWLAEFLLHSFRTTIATRRRVMRTLKCLVVDQQNQSIPVDELASVIVLGVLPNDDVPTQILACQTALSLVNRTTSSSTSSSICSPTLEHSVVQCIETAQSDKLLFLAMQLLTSIMENSQWNRSAQCFANQRFYQQIQDFLQRNRHLHATVVAKMLVSLQQKTTKTSMDKLMCDHYLSILALLLSVPSTRRLVVTMLHRMVQHFAKELAADENLMNALVILCLEENNQHRYRPNHHRRSSSSSSHEPSKQGTFKDSVKGLILQLIPEL